MKIVTLTQTHQLELKCLDYVSTNYFGIFPVYKNRFSNFYHIENLPPIYCQSMGMGAGSCCSNSRVEDFICSQSLSELLILVEGYRAELKGKTYCIQTRLINQLIM